MSETPSASASTYSESDIFARVKDGRIVDYPVSYQAIINRAHPFSMYVCVEFDERPDVPPFHQCVEKVELLKDGRVLVRYLDPKPIPLQHLLRLINVETRPGVPNNDTIFTQDLQQQIFRLAEKRIEELLDGVALDRGYRSVETAVSYETSSVEAYSRDAKDIKKLRDDVWVAFTSYKNKVFNKDLPFPTQWLDFTSVLPKIQWPTDMKTSS